MDKRNLLFVKQAMLIPVFALYSILLDQYLSGYGIVYPKISGLELDSPFFNYTHRLADILIGVSLCLFSFSCLSKAKAKFTFLAMFSFGVIWLLDGFFMMKNPLHDAYVLTAIVVIVPAVFALEMRDFYASKHFRNFCMLVFVIHVVFTWFFYFGLFDFEIADVMQRVWVAITLFWYGLAAYKVYSVANKSNGYTAEKRLVESDSVEPVQNS